MRVRKIVAGVGFLLLASAVAMALLSDGTYTFTPTGGSSYGGTVTGTGATLTVDNVEYERGVPPDDDIYTSDDGARFEFNGNANTGTYTHYGVDGQPTQSGTYRRP